MVQHHNQNRVFTQEKEKMKMAEQILGLKGSIWKFSIGFSPAPSLHVLHTRFCVTSQKSIGIFSFNIFFQCCWILYRNLLIHYLQLILWNSVQYKHISAQKAATQYSGKYLTLSQEILWVIGLTNKEFRIQNFTQTNDHFTLTLFFQGLCTHSHITKNPNGKSEERSNHLQFSNFMALL